MIFFFIFNNEFMKTQSILNTQIFCCCFAPGRWTLRLTGCLSQVS